MKRVAIAGLLILAAMAGCRPRVRIRNTSAKDVTASKSAAKSRSRRASEEASGRTSTLTAGTNCDDLAATRRAFVSQLTVRGPVPQEYEVASPPDGVHQVTYESSGMQLNGWLSANPGDGKKRPAVVFLHGGWAFGAEDWSQGKSFIDAEFVLFMPMLRGENGNPGNYEAFFGEVDDAVAAGQFVASQSHVDANKVFLVGHSVGAILTCLATMLASPYKAAPAYDGSVEMRAFASALPKEYFPFDKRMIEEVSIRNAMDFAPSIRIPLRLFATADGHAANSQLAAKASQVGKDVKGNHVNGNHHTMVTSAVRRAIKWFEELAGK